MPYALRFGRAEFRPDERALFVDGASANLGARALDLLHALIERRDRVVAKTELLDLVWPGLVVEENNLQVQVSSLRKALGPQAIATVPGRGYRFVAPLDEPEAAAGAALVAGSTVLPGRRSTLPPRRHGTLLGRDDDVGQLAALCAQRRLVCIVGAGGIGKTRVAQEVAQAAAASFADGVAWVELAPLADPVLIPAAIAAAAGVELAPRRDPRESLLAQIERRHLLLVLDNAEHLLDALARLARDLLGAAPGLALLVTSQVPLRLDDELVYRLGGLAVPKYDTGLDHAAEHGAVALFVARAQAADRRFRLDAGNVATVVDICRQLDGVALAIEMAAARVAALGLAKVHAGLQQRLRLLTAGQRVADARHQSLQAALDWSHALLDDDEQAVLRRVGVFRGGFTLELAHAAAVDPQLDEWAVTEALAALVERSLVVADDADPPRYRLLESTREYALVRLARAGESGVTNRRHAQALLALFDAAEAATSAGDRSRAAAFARSSARELDNLRAAVEWALVHDARLAVALVASGSLLMARQSLYQELAHWYDASERLLGGVPRPEAARWLNSMAATWFGLSVARARAAAARAAQLCRELGDAQGEYRALISFVRRAIRPDAATEAALAAALRLEDPRWPARLLDDGRSAESHHLMLTGGFARGRAMRRALVETRRAAGGKPLGLALLGLTSLELAAGDNAAAVRLARENIELLRGRRWPHLHCLALCQLTAALLGSGDLAGAHAAAAQALPMAVELGELHSIDDAAVLLALAEGRVESAARLLGFADAANAAHAGEHHFLWARQREAAWQQLARTLDADTLAALMRAGASLSAAEMTRLALEPSTADAEVPGQIT